MYNHALVAFPGSHIIVADLDEYLITPRSTTIEQVRGSGGEGGRPLLTH